MIMMMLENFTGPLRSLSGCQYFQGPVWARGRLGTKDPMERGKLALRCSPRLRSWCVSGWGLGGGGYARVRI